MDPESKFALMRRELFRLGGGLIGAVPAFAAFLPKPEPTRPDDKAEALEPVEFEFGWKKKHTDHEDDEIVRFSTGFLTNLHAGFWKLGLDAFEVFEDACAALRDEFPPRQCGRAARAGR